MNKMLEHQPIGQFVSQWKDSCEISHRPSILMSWNRSDSREPAAPASLPVMFSISSHGQLRQKC